MGTQKIRNLPTVQEAWVQSLGQKYPRRTEWQPTCAFLPAEFRDRAEACWATIFGVT